jgi:hypothetical protein
VRPPGSLLAACLAAAVVAAPEPVPPPTLEAVMAGMAGSRGVVAHFEETKEVALLRAPLTSRGVLHYVPPDRMVRRTLEPVASELVIDGERMWYRDDLRSEPTDLSGDPAARHFAGSFVVLFGGDRAALEARYETRFEADGSDWLLRLGPRDGTVRRFVTELALRGDGRSLRELSIREADGDVSTTRFLEVDPDYEHSQDELRELFAR